MSKKKIDTSAFKRFFTEHPVVIGVKKYAKENSFIGFHGVPLYDVVVFVINEATRDDLFTRANSVAFSIFLSLFPSILTLFTLVPFALDFLTIWFPALENFNMTLYEEIKRVMPGQAGDIVFGFVQEITNSPKVGLLSFGFLLAIFFSSNGMLSLMQAFEKSYVKVFRQRGFLRKRMVAVGLTFLVGIFIIASVVLVILGDSIIGWIDYYTSMGGFTRFLINAVRWTTMLALYYIIIGTLYRYGAATIKRFSYVSPGVTLATILSLATSVAFSFYIDGFNRYDTYTKFYGSIATIIIVMLWLQLNALILIIGFELNAAIAVHRDLTQVDEEE
ncbi:YihY/virulence factor BrkB family protein [Neolewinella litorea]|uniref:YihY/virulence factor BrkB family protein n=1 Tax=Neolewinella litorea TaxID=2562452 RepID=A0A4S4NWG2_9BACT|nr:YihY/virulence factor BrkB family protein [Neolewinella litorea]THH40610.1 YihY/virulence factor BrkB family protein [Neolewinella litorea]